MIRAQLYNNFFTKFFNGGIGKLPLKFTNDYHFNTCFGHYFAFILLLNEKKIQETRIILKALAI